MPKKGFVYIVTNKNKTVLYIGVTSHLLKRITQHKDHFYKKSFTDRYQVEFLIYYETFDSIVTAIAREKEIKRWRREKKEALVATVNPEWVDLFPALQQSIL